MDEDEEYEGNDEESDEENRASRFYTTTNPKNNKI